MYGLVFISCSIMNVCVCVFKSICGWPHKIVTTNFFHGNIDRFPLNETHIYKQTLLTHTRQKKTTKMILWFGPIFMCASLRSFLFLQLTFFYIIWSAQSVWAIKVYSVRSFYLMMIEWVSSQTENKNIDNTDTFQHIDLFKWKSNYNRKVKTEKLLRKFVGKIHLNKIIKVIKSQKWV